MPNPALPPGAKAWILMDVDGVLNVTCSKAGAKRLGLARVRATGGPYTYTLYLHRWVGESIARHPHLAPAWATTWMRAVDTGWPGTISETSGFAPGLPAVDLTEYVAGRHGSKVDGILDFVGTEPFIWIDDDPAATDPARLAQSGVPHLFIHTDDTVGVTPEHIARAAAWAANL